MPGMMYQWLYEKSDTGTVENNADYGHDTGCCGKEPDHYTGAMARVVGEMSGASTIFIGSLFGSESTILSLIILCS